jgi:hypothetical protein
MSSTRFNTNDYLIAFFIGSSFMFSNVKLMGVDLNNVLTILSLFVALTSEIDYDAVLTTFVIGLFVFVSTIINANTLDYFYTFFYKITTIYPVILLINRKAYLSSYIACLHSFILSNLLAILYLIINGGTTHKFILYFDTIPRYAALAKEPVSFAMFTFGTYILSFFINPKFSLKKSFIWTIPIVVAISGVIIFKVVSDILWKFKKRFYYYWVIILIPFAILFFILWTNTRMGDSFSARVGQYLDLLNGQEYVIFGSGFYQRKGFSDGLPGLLRVYFELGFIFYLTLFITVFYKVYTCHIWKQPLLLLAIFFPFLTEAYGAQFMWLIFGFALTYRNEIKPKYFSKVSNLYVH